MPLELFDEWRALYDLEPWGEERSELQHGMLCSLVSACHPDAVKPKPPADYMPYAPKDLKSPPQQPENEMKSAVQAICSQRRKIEKKRVKKK